MLMELLYVTGIIALFGIVQPSPLESLKFIRGSPPSCSTTHIWLNNAAAALFLSSLGAIHPALSYLGMIPVIVSEGHVLASWRAGYVPNSHLTYSLAEDQAYLLSSLLGIGFHLRIDRLKDLSERWREFNRFVPLTASLVTIVFLFLAVIEVWEVLLWG